MTFFFFPLPKGHHQFSVKGIDDYRVHSHILDVALHRPSQL